MLKFKTNALKITLFMIILMPSLLITACAKPPSTDPVQTAGSNSDELTIAAASDLMKAFGEIGPLFEAQYACKVTFTFGSTGTQTEQIANGAPFDIFAAANESALELLDSKGLILSDSKKHYGLGRIGVVTSKDRNVHAATLEDLLNDSIKKIAIANPDHAPYGLAAKQALISAGLWDQLEPKLVYGKNIADAMTFVTTGNADAGIIAISLKEDATMNFTLIDPKYHEPLRQAAAVIKTSKNETLARAFIDFITSETGRQILIKYGFAIPQD
jgi:molybdate transport system substrate-binding protein